MDFVDREMAKTTKGRPRARKGGRRARHWRILVKAEWDRCTRSMTDGIGIVERVEKRGASSSRERLDLTTADLSRTGDAKVRPISALSAATRYA